MQFLAQFQVENILFVRPRVLKDSCFCFLLYFRILFSRHLSTFPLSLPHWLRFKHPYCCPSFVPESKWRCSIINQIRQCVLVVVDNAQPPTYLTPGAGSGASKPCHVIEMWVTEEEAPMAETMNNWWRSEEDTVCRAFFYSQPRHFMFLFLSTHLW